MQRVKKNKKTKFIKIVLLTARVDEDAKLKALQNGADDFITKPFSALELKSRVQNLLENKKLQTKINNKNKELKDALKNLKTTQGQLIQSEKINALGNLSAGLLHEINNPLNYTMTALEIIKNDPLLNQDKDNKEIIEDIEEGMNRIKLIITDLRAFLHTLKSLKKNAYLT